MSKKSSARGANLKPIQASVPANVPKENTDQLIEMAAEQLADLLWMCWLARNRSKGDKRGSKSNTRTDGARSS